MTNDPAAKCADTNRAGEPCQMPPLGDSLFCWAHDPSRGADRARARREGGRKRATPTLSTLPEAAPSLRSVPAIQAQLERAYWDSLALPNSAQRSRALGSLLMIAAKLLEVGELEARLEALEALPGLRRA
jgi:hypothetical protein